jgi:hypothetical protein
MRGPGRHARSGPPCAVRPAGHPHAPSAALSALNLSDPGDVVAGGRSREIKSRKPIRDDRGVTRFRPFNLLADSVHSLLKLCELVLLPVDLRGKSLFLVESGCESREGAVICWRSGLSSAWARGARMAAQTAHGARTAHGGRERAWRPGPRMAARTADGIASETPCWLIGPA